MFSGKKEENNNILKFILNHPFSQVVMLIAEKIKFIYRIYYYSI